MANQNPFNTRGMITYLAVLLDYNFLLTKLRHFLLSRDEFVLLGNQCWVNVKMHFSDMSFQFKRRCYLPLPRELEQDLIFLSVPIPFQNDKLR